MNTEAHPFLPSPQVEFFSVGGKKKRKKRACITDAATHQDESFMCYFNYRENMESKTICCIPCFI